MAVISIPVSLQHTEAAHNALTSFIDGAENGEYDVEEMLNQLAFVRDCLEDQINEIIAATER